MGDWAAVAGEALAGWSGTLRRDEPLGRHTTFRIGGPAAVFLEAGTRKDLVRALALVKERAPAWRIIGQGSNLLVSDQGFAGIVLRLGREFAGLEFEGAEVRVGAACPLAGLVEGALAQSLTGAEFLWGIPGSVGGALKMNAGAFEHQLGELVTSARILTPDGSEIELGRRDLKFGYRQSSLPLGGIVVSASLKLRAGDRETMLRQIESIKAKRLASQPKGASAGCVFKNPKGEAAGRLIDKAGLKGTRIGDAIVSELHANYIINQGRASFSDVYQLMELMKLKVEVKFGIILEEEVEIVANR